MTASEGWSRRFARTMVRRRRRVLALWVLALVVVIVTAGAVGGEHRVDYATPGSESAAAQRLLGARLPELSGDTVDFVFRAPAGVDAPDDARAIQAVMDEALTIDHVRSATVGATSVDGTVQLATVQLDGTIEKVPVSTASDLLAVADRADSATLEVEAGGPSIQNAEGTEAGSEQLGLVLALVILLIAFGSVIAAGLPLLVAVFGVGFAMAAIPLLNNVFVVPDFAVALVSMIGIGVGIDYALFIVTRHRAALADGASVEDAVALAMSTAGRAVLFAGGTVVVSMLGLCAMGLDYLDGTAAAVILGVLVVLAATMTLLPASLGFAGRSIDRFRLPFVKGDRGDTGLWARWSRVVQRRPRATALGALCLLLLIASPFLSMRFGYPDASSGPESASSRRAYDIVSDAFGPGVNGPLVLAVDLSGAPVDTGPDVLDDLVGTLARTDGVTAVLPPTVNAAGDTAAIVVVPSSGPQTAATRALIGHLRNDVLPSAVAGTGATVHVGGANAAFADESTYMAGRLPIFIGSVIVLSFLLLLTVFRSVLVAVKAAIMNVLAIAAAYGVMALALQGGWFGELFGITEPTPVPVWAPMMIFAIMFGLSMDYEVFLLSRIREEYLRSGDNSGAVAIGMARTGRVITAAAAVMISVFGAFILGDQAVVKVIGLGTSTAVLLDATVVRMALVPSTMELLGDRNWWMPNWLDRLLPHLDVGDGHESSADDQTLDTGAVDTAPLDPQAADRDLEPAGV